MNATPEMIQKAKNNKIHEKGKHSWETYTKKFEWFARCQNLGPYIKLAVYEPQTLALGIKTARYEVFIDAKNKDYITRILNDDGSEREWRGGMLQNILPYNHYYYSSPTGCAKENLYINAMGTKTLKGLNKDKSLKPMRALDVWQESVLEYKREERERRETSPWDEEMNKVQPVAKEFIKWLEHKRPEREFAIYHGGSETVYCTRCRKEVKLEHKIIRDTLQVCPSCGKALKIVFGLTHKLPMHDDTLYSQIVEPYEGGVIARTFYSYRQIDLRNKKVKLHQAKEVLRTILTPEKQEQYCWCLYKNRTERWVKQNGIEYRYWYTPRIYTENMAEVKALVDRYTAVMNVAGKMATSIESFMAAEKEEKALEPLAKIGMIELARTLTYDGKRYYKYSSKYTDQSQTELTKILKIDTARLKRLRAMTSPAADLTTLAWMQLEKKENKVFPEEVFEFYTVANLEPSDIDNKPPQMSYLQFARYLCIQACKHTEYKSLHELGRNVIDELRTYEDYMRMAERLKMNLNSSMVYKPKDLKAAHDECVELLQRGSMEETAKKTEKRFKGIKKVFPELEKYEYQADGYIVKAPKSVYDIVREGTLLKHCIHTCDYYFERMLTRESTIMFLRKADAPESPWYTLELEPGGNIRQKRTVGDTQNKDLEEALPFLKKYQAQLQKKLTKKDKELARISDEKRRANYKKAREENKRVWHGKLQGQLLADVLEADFMAAI